MKTTGFVILDLAGTTLSAEERELLQHPCTAGVILFARNYENPTQLRALTAVLKQQKPLFQSTIHYHYSF